MKRSILCIIILLISTEKSLSSCVVDMEFTPKFSASEDYSLFLGEITGITNDGDLIVKPLQSYNLPGDIDTIFAGSCFLNNNCRYAGIKYDSSYINRDILLGGIISRTSANRRNATIHTGCWTYSNFMVIDPDRKQYDFNRKIDSKKEFMNKNIDLNFELVKEMTLLGKLTSKRRRIDVVKNLMFHKYFVRYPDKFKEFVTTNLKDISEKRRNKLVNMQLQIYEPESWK